MTEITKELKNQCQVQEQECIQLDADKARIKDEVENVTKRMETLASEKKRVEQKLEQLRLENSKLEEFLEGHKKGVAS